MPKPLFDIPEVKSRAFGHWDRILGSLAPSLAEALERPGRHVACPVHGGVDGFRLFRNYRDTGGGVCNTCGAFADGFALLCFVNACRFSEALADVAGEVGVTPEGGEGAPRTPRAPRTPPPAPPKVDNTAEDKALRDRLRAIFQQGLPLTNPASEPARLYLKNRGLKLLPTVLRMHPGLYYRDEDGVLEGPFPTLISPVTDAQHRGVCLHRLYLTPDGKKAPVPEPKKLMSHPSDTSMRGAAVRLFPYKDVLGIAEGIETAIAATEGTGIPCWSCITSTLLPSWVPPRDVQRVVVFGDKDVPSKLYPNGAGQEAAKLLVSTLWARGIKASLAIPSSDIPEGSKSVDWLDEYVNRGASAFKAVVNG